MDKEIKKCKRCGREDAEDCLIGSDDYCDACRDEMEVIDINDDNLQEGKFLDKVKTSLDDLLFDYVDDDILDISEYEKDILAIYNKSHDFNIAHDEAVKYLATLDDPVLKEVAQREDGEKMVNDAVNKILYKAVEEDDEQPLKDDTGLDEAMSDFLLSKNDVCDFIEKELSGCHFIKATRDEDGFDVVMNQDAIPDTSDEFKEMIPMYYRIDVNELEEEGVNNEIVEVVCRYSDASMESNGWEEYFNYPDENNDDHLKYLKEYLVDTFSDASFNDFIDELANEYVTEDVEDDDLIVPSSTIKSGDIILSPEQYEMIQNCSVDDVYSREDVDADNTIQDTFLLENACEALKKALAQAKADEEFPDNIDPSDLYAIGDLENILWLCKETKLGDALMLATGEGADELPNKNAIIAVLNKAVEWTENHELYIDVDGYKFDDLKEDLPNDMVTIHCYNQESRMPRNDAIREFTRAVKACDGSERERYEKILMDLEAGETECFDDDLEYLSFHNNTPIVNKITSRQKDQIVNIIKDAKPGDYIREQVDDIVVMVNPTINSDTRQETGETKFSVFNGNGLNLKDIAVNDGEFEDVKDSFIKWLDAYVEDSEVIENLNEEVKEIGNTKYFKCEYDDPHDSVCPYCGSDDIDLYWDFIDDEADWANYEGVCHNCGGYFRTSELIERSFDGIWDNDYDSFISGAWYNDDGKYLDPADDRNAEILSTLNDTYETEVIENLHESLDDIPEQLRDKVQELARAIHNEFGFDYGQVLEGMIQEIAEQINDDNREEIINGILNMEPEAYIEQFRNMLDGADEEVLDQAERYIGTETIE